MTYKELQQALKGLRNQGIAIFCKLNDSKEILQSEYDRLQYVAPWDTQEDVDFDADTDDIINSDEDDWSECFDTLPSDVFYSDADLDSIEGNPDIDYNAPSLLDECEGENENDSQSLLQELETEIKKRNFPIYRDVIGTPKENTLVVGLSKYTAYSTITIDKGVYSIDDNGYLYGTDKPCILPDIKSVINYIEGVWEYSLETQHIDITKERLADWLGIKASLINNALYSKTQKRWFIFCQDGNTLHAPLMAARVPSLTMKEIVA